MLRKLMKHELRATGRTMVPMLLTVLLSAVGGNLAVNRLLETDSRVLSTLGVALLTVFFIAIMTSGVLAFVLMVQRFYKNLLCDEGYLMMTLPVSVHEQIWSKLLVSLIWWVAVVAAAGAAMFILVFNLRMVQSMLDFLAQLKLVDIGSIWRNVPQAIVLLLQLVLLLLVGGACVCLHFYAALAVGHSFTHHKSALSVAGFFVLPMALSVLQKLVMTVLNLVRFEGIRLWLDSLAPLTQTHLALLGVTLVMAIPAALYYLLTAYFLKNKLNLG